MPREQAKRKAPPGPSGSRSRGDARRKRIFRSLHDCIINQGYTRTTLADIAEGANMSASHLLYYFKGKEAILEQYFESVSVRFLGRIESFRAHPVAEQPRLLADFWFRGERITRSEIGFMLECFGAAVHDEVLRVTKSGFDSRCKSYLTDFFASTPRAFMGNPKDAAELAYSLMIGLRSAVYFDDNVALEDAHRLFLSSLHSMAGFD